MSMDKINKALAQVDLSRLPEDQALLLMRIHAGVAALALKEVGETLSLHYIEREKNKLQNLFKDSSAYDLSIDLFKILGILDDKEKVTIGPRGVGRLLGGIQAIYENRSKLLNPDKRHTIESLYEKFYKHFAIEGEGTFPRLKQRYKDARDEARDFLKRKLPTSL